VARHRTVVRPDLPPGPVRTCVGCRERATRSDLLRVVAGTGPDGSPAAVPDPRGCAPGRGAHLHPVTSCFDLAVRRRAFGRALRAGPSLSGAPVGDWIAALATEGGTGTTSTTSTAHDSTARGDAGVTDHTRNWSTGS